MRAIGGNYADEEAVALSVRAGIDVILYGHDSNRAARAFEFLHTEAERFPAVRAQVESSFRRIARLKENSLKGFVGITTGDPVEQLARLGHQRILEEI
jgi:hypothetical protein